MKNCELFKECFGTDMETLVYKFLVDFGLIDYEKIEEWESQENEHVQSVVLKKQIRGDVK